MAIDHRQAVKTFLRETADFFSTDDGVETQFIIDDAGGHYQLVRVGWKGERWIYGCVMHLDIKQTQIWSQHNSTEILIDRELIRLGVAEQDIVISFIPPWEREWNTSQVNAA